MRGEWFQREAMIAAAVEKGGWEPYLLSLLPEPRGRWAVETYHRHPYVAPPAPPA